MDILVACDKNFIPHTATTVASVLYWNPGSTIHWIRHSFSKQQDQKISQFVKRLNGTLHLYEARQEYFENFSVGQHASAANYFRLQAHFLLPEGIERLLYLDSDVIVRRPLHQIWSVDFEGYYLAAVRDQGAPYFAGELGLEEEKYFNSGVMLIPIQRWRKEGIFDQVLSYIRRNSANLRFWDQDGLNSVMKGKWLPLSYSYNAQPILFSDSRHNIAFRQIASDPHIVHFAGGSKPWNSALTHPFAHDYARYRALTPWPKFKMRNSNSFGGLRAVKAQIEKVWANQLPKSRAGMTVQDIVRKTSVYKAIHKKRVLGKSWQELQHQQRRAETYRVQEQRAKLFCETIFRNDTRVRTGPFKGMKCLGLATCSQVLPKISGTYEQPIHELIDRWSKDSTFETVVNVGCAEGYYAVGMALLFPTCEILAFDKSGSAQEQCADSAKINNVLHRIEISGECDQRTIRRVCGAGVLLICDIEGYEEELLDPIAVPSLSQTEILVESHDFLRPGMTESLIEKFRLSHSVRVIVDHKRNAWLLRNQLRDEGIEVSPEEMKWLLDEDRPSGMRWLHMLPISRLK